MLAISSSDILCKGIRLWARDRRCGTVCSVRTNYDKVGALINNGFEAAKRYGAQANGQSSGSRAQNPKHRNQRPNQRPTNGEWRMQTRDQRPETRDQSPMTSQVMRILQESLHLPASYYISCTATYMCVCVCLLWRINAKPGTVCIQHEPVFY